MKRLTSFLICILILFSSVVNAHPGRLDSNGGHYNRSTGEYHYHKGGGSSSDESSGSTDYTAPKTVYASKINVSNMPSTIYVGESIKLSGAVYPSNAVDQDLTWISDNAAVATIDSEGNLTAIAPGTVVISVSTSMGTTSQYTLTVKEVVAENITIENKPFEMLIGETIQLSATIAPENTTNKEIEWKSENSSIAIIDNEGELTGISVGKTIISVVHRELVDSFEIEIKPIFAESIKIELHDEETNELLEEYRFQIGEEILLDAVITPYDTTDQTISWSVDNTEIAKIHEFDYLVGIKAGTVTLTATASNGITDSIELEIYKTPFVIKAFEAILKAYFAILSTEIRIWFFGVLVLIVITLVKKKK